MNIQNLKFPIGPAPTDKNPDLALRLQYIDEISAFPSNLDTLVQNLTNDELNWRYRPGGWSIKQVVHHCADSHMNSFIRFKLALTEEVPSIRPYHEDLWAELVDGQDTNIDYSLDLLKGLHARWIVLLKSLTEEQLMLEFKHPEHGTIFNLAENIGVYAWHGNHHLAHIKNAIASKGNYNDIQ